MDKSNDNFKEYRSNKVLAVKERFVENLAEIREVLQSILVNEKVFIYRIRMIEYRQENLMNYKSYEGYPFLCCDVAWPWFPSIKVDLILIRYTLDGISEKDIDAFTTIKTANLRIDNRIPLLLEQIRHPKCQNNRKMLEDPVDLLQRKITDWPLQISK